MSANKRRIEIWMGVIFDRYLRHKASDSEREFVDNFYDAVQGEAPTAEELQRLETEIKNNIDTRITASTPGENATHPKPDPKPQPLKYPLFRRLSALQLAAACILIFMLSTSLYYMLWQNTSGSRQLDDANPSTPVLLVGKKERYNLVESLPKGATYKMLNDEKVLDLSTLEEGGMSKELTIENPGQQVFSVLLSDGSQVWLNRNAIIRLDPGFEQGKRDVHVRGEVFFDVLQLKKDGQSLPFTVQTELQTIAVLGTQFIVDASKNTEENVQLLEGSIRLSAKHSNGNNVLLKPGQKAYLQRNTNQILVMTGENEAKAKAWRKGMFYFDNETLAAVAEELQVWYGITISVSPAIADLPISGIFSRYSDIIDVLEIIKLTNTITYEFKKGDLYVDKKD